MKEAVLGSTYAIPVFCEISMTEFIVKHLNQTPNQITLTRQVFHFKQIATSKYYYLSCIMSGKNRRAPSSFITRSITSCWTSFATFGSFAISGSMQSIIALFAFFLRSTWLVNFLKFEFHTGRAMQFFSVNCIGNLVDIYDFLYETKGMFKPPHYSISNQLRCSIQMLFVMAWLDHFRQPALTY